MKQSSDVETTTSSRPLFGAGVAMDGSVLVWVRQAGAAPRGAVSPPDGPYLVTRPHASATVSPSLPPAALRYSRAIHRRIATRPSQTGRDAQAYRLGSVRRSWPRLRRGLRRGHRGGLPTPPEIKRGASAECRASASWSRA